MKKNLLYLAPLAIAVFTLSACTSTTPASVETQSPSSENTPITADSILDDQLFGEGVATNDLSKCELIANAGRKEECLSVVEANTLLAEALENMNVSTCDNIELERYQEACKDSVNEKIVDKNATENELEYLQQQNDLSTKYIQQSNEEGCYTIKEENFKKDCVNNVLVSKALKSGDKTFCQKMIGEDKILDCENSLSE